MLLKIATVVHLTECGRTFRRSGRGFFQDSGESRRVGANERGQCFNGADLSAKEPFVEEWDYLCTSLLATLAYNFRQDLQDYCDNKIPSIL